MKIRELAHQWEQQATTSGTTRSYRLDLEVDGVANLPRHAEAPAADAAYAVDDDHRR